MILDVRLTDMAPFQIQNVSSTDFNTRNESITNNQLPILIIRFYDATHPDMHIHLDRIISIRTTND